MRTCQYLGLTGDLPKYITGLGPVHERDSRPCFEDQTPCDLHDPDCVQVGPSVEVE